MEKNGSGLKPNAIAKLLKKASEAYYSGVSQIMTDSEFDSLRDELAAIAPDHPFLKSIGASVSISVWPKRRHDFHMGSLSKVNNREEYEKWASDKGDGLVQISHKLDGSTIVLTYDKGKLLHAVTRGDGEEGEDITANVVKMKNVLTTLPLPFTGVMRGEMILLKGDYDKYYKSRGYKNPRNAANGCARDKKGNGLIEHIKVIYFDIKAAARLEHMTSEQVKADFLSSMGLDYVHVDYKLVATAWDYFEKFDRDSLPYEIDGLVVKICDIPTQESYGVTDGRPKGTIAIKFAPKVSATKLKDITWQVGLSGRITPVAELEPVELGGVTISRSTLNNLDYIDALNIEIGDIVKVARLNDVIPGIVGVAQKANKRGGINLPTKCPSCGQTLERDGAYIVCPFTQCAGAVFGDMATWVKTHNMLGFGRVVLSELIEAGITTPDKLYMATAQQLADASGSVKVGQKLAAVIDNTREMTLDKFLAGFNIPHLGKTNSKRLAKKFKSLDAIYAASVGELQEVEGIKTTAKTIHKGIMEKENLMDKVLEHVEIRAPEASGPLGGKSFAMTGLRNIDGKDVGEMIIGNGGDLKSGVSKGLDYLIIKDPLSTSNKAQKARKYGTKLISPEEFIKMMNKGGPK